MGIRQGWYDKGLTDPTYSSDFDAALMRSVIRSGVVPGYGDDMVVTATDPVSMNIRVGLGAIFNEGRWLEVHTGIETRTVPDSDATNPRIDRVVIRNDFLADPDATVLVIKKGDAAVNPVPPALQRDSTWWERSLAQIRVPAGALSITASNITDERDDPAVCGRADTHGLVRHATAAILDHPNGSVTGAKIAANTIGTGNLADASVTDPKMATPKISRAGDTMTGKLNVNAGQDTTGLEIQADAGTVAGFLRLTFHQFTRWAANVRVTNRLFRFMETDTIMARVHASEFRVYGTIGDVENEVRHDGNSDGWVTTARLALAAVITDRIADLAVTAAKLADGAVTATKLATDAVTSSKIASDAVTNAKIATAAVSTSKIGDLHVTTAKVADGAITAVKVATDAVTAAKIAASAVTNAKIDAGAVTPDKTSANIAKIATGSYTGDSTLNRSISTGLSNNRTVIVFSDSSLTTSLGAGGGIGIRDASMGYGKVPTQGSIDIRLADTAAERPIVAATSFTVSHNSNDATLNYSGVVYHWIAFGA